MREAKEQDALDVEEWGPLPKKCVRQTLTKEREKKREKGREEEGRREGEGMREREVEVVEKLQ